MPQDVVTEAVRLLPTETGWKISADASFVAEHCVTGSPYDCTARTQSYYVEGTEGPEDEDDVTYVESRAGWAGPNGRSDYWPGWTNMPLTDGVYLTPEAVDTGGPDAVYTHLRVILWNSHGDVFYSEWVKARDPIPHETPVLKITAVDTSKLQVTVGSSALYMPNRECMGPCRTEIWGYSPTWGTRSLGSFSGVTGAVRHENGDYGYTRLWAVLIIPGSTEPFTTAKIAMPNGNPRGKIEGGVDLLAADALLLSRAVTAEELCLPLNTFRVAPGEPTVTTAYTECDQVARSQGTLAAVRRVAQLGGAAAVSIILAAAYALPLAPGQTPPAQPAPAPVDEPGRPPVWSSSPEQEMQDIADSLRLRRNASRPIPEEWIAYVAKTCYETATKGSIAPQSCKRLPIFLPGAEVWEPAAHDADAIVSDPRWLRLTRGGNWPDKWYQKTDTCKKGSYVGDLINCDEYPYKDTQQGGPATLAPPKKEASLRLVDGPQNIREGGLLGGFYSNCKVPTADGTYLVVPLVLPGTTTAPPAGWPTTARACTK